MAKDEVPSQKWIDISGRFYRAALLVNLMEEPICEIPISEGRVELNFTPFEIVTVKLSVIDMEY